MFVMASILCWPHHLYAVANDQQLIASWYSNTFNNIDETTKRLLQLMEDQSYVSIKLLCSSKKLVWVEEHSGTWKLDKNTLVLMPQHYNGFNGVKQAEAGTTLIYTDITLTDGAMSLKEPEQTEIIFQHYNGNFSMRCSGLM